jgi:hypothetical protein
MLPRDAVYSSQLPSVSSPFGSTQREQVETSCTHIFNCPTSGLNISVSSLKMLFGSNFLDCVVLYRVNQKKGLLEEMGVLKIKAPTDISFLTRVSHSGGYLQ